MSGLKIGVIAGTSDATQWIQTLPKEYQVTAFVATPYGQTILAQTGCVVQVGRLDAVGFTRALEEMDAVVDASHPFAVEVTATVRQVCQQLGIPYFRLVRQRTTYDYDQIHWVDTKEDAAALVAEMTGNILWTTGSNTLAYYEATIPSFASRSWVRVLDTPESRRQTASSRAHLIYAMPPFSVADTAACLRDHAIRILVSKDSGQRGGVVEKIQAAKECGVQVVLIAAPVEVGMTGAQIQRALAQLGKEARK